ncbi:MAG: hypothetical protein ACRDNP_11705 [Gaiellaceae bacterium]
MTTSTSTCSGLVQVDDYVEPDRGPFDDMIRGRRLAAVEPRRVVVELRPDEYRALEDACKGRCLTAPELIKLVALRLARVV